MLFGGLPADVESREVQVDPKIPRGARIERQPRPHHGHALCAPRGNVCVHADTDSRVDLESVQNLLNAYELATQVAQLPAPRADGQLGGGPQLDMYLGVNAVSTPRWEAVTALADPAAPGDDRASAFCVTPENHLDLHTAMRCVGGAIALDRDAAETPAARRAYANYVTQWLVGPDQRAAAELDDAQSNPQLSTLPREVTNGAGSGALWFEYLDARLGAGSPGDLVTSLLTLSRRSSTKDEPLAEPTGPEWNNEPDLFDVLRASLDDEPRRYADVLGDWALNRAFLGSRCDGSHPTNQRWLGDFGRLVFDWTLAYSSLPRKVAGSRALEPMGIAAVWLDLDSVTLGAKLGVQIEWERPVSFRWVAASVDQNGNELARWELPYLQTAHTVEKTLMNFEGASGLLFVGINLGGVDPSHPYDPDYEPWEPHAYTIYLTEVP